MSNLIVGVKHSIGLRTMFSPNFYSVSRGGNFGMFAHSTTLISCFYAAHVCTLYMILKDSALPFLL